MPAREARKVMPQRRSDCFVGRDMCTLSDISSCCYTYVCVRERERELRIIIISISIIIISYYYYVRIHTCKQYLPQ